MDETARIIQFLKTTPPSCVAGFRLTAAELPIAWDNNTRSTWRLACECGCEKGQVLGYPLANFNADLPDGPDVFIGPIGFQCAACGIVTEVIDTGSHGYHAEVTKREGGAVSMKRHHGEGPRTKWSCSQCKGTIFIVTVAFIFWGANFDLAEDEPDWPVQEFFCVFLSFAHCVGCGHLSQPTDFGKL